MEIREGTCWPGRGPRGGEMAGEYPMPREGMGRNVLSEGLRDRLVRLLRGLEQAADGVAVLQCPTCGGHETTHAPDCELAACLRELERL